MGSPAKKFATYEDILKLPDHLRGEIIFGELITSARPSTAHQKAMIKMATRLENGFGEGTGGRGGWIFLTEPELHLESHVIIPDLAAWRSERVDAKFYEDTYPSIIPDWVCEIQSPSTARVDRVTKRRVYLDLKIPYYWLLDPIARTLEVMKFSDQGYITIGSWGGEDKITTEPFTDLSFDLNLFWVPIPS